MKICSKELANSIANIPDIPPTIATCALSSCTGIARSIKCLTIYALIVVLFISWLAWRALNIIVKEAFFIAFFAPRQSCSTGCTSTILMVVKLAWRWASCAHICTCNLFGHCRVCYRSHSKWEPFNIIFSNSFTLVTAAKEITTICALHINCQGLVAYASPGICFRLRIPAYVFITHALTTLWVS